MSFHLMRYSTRMAFWPSSGIKRTPLIRSTSAVPCARPGVRTRARGHACASTTGGRTSDEAAMTCTGLTRRLGCCRRAALGSASERLGACAARSRAALAHPRAPESSIVMPSVKRARAAGGGCGFGAQPPSVGAERPPHDAADAAPAHAAASSLPETALGERDEWICCTGRVQRRTIGTQKASRVLWLVKGCVHEPHHIS